MTGATVDYHTLSINQDTGAVNDPRPNAQLTSSMIDRFLSRTRIAYFSMEIAISPDMPTYSGGLGILAGDTARVAADLDLPMVFVTLVSRAGYLRQQLDPSFLLGVSATPCSARLL